MSEETVNKKVRFDFSNYGIVVGFLCLEVLAFVSFYLGHSFLLYGILSLVLMLLLLLVTFRQIKVDQISSFAFFIFPIFVFGLLTALSRFNYNSVGAIGVAESIFVPICLTCIGLSGFLSTYISKFKIRTALLVIYSALGIFVLINLIATMVYYVPFYTLIYKNSYFVYDGKASLVPIGSMAYMLYGFQISEVSIGYWSLFPSLLLTAVIPLFFIKYKENRNVFLIYLGLSILAFISLLFTISKLTLLSDLVLIVGITIIILAGKLKQYRGVFNWMMIAIGAIVVIAIIILFLNAQKNWGFTTGLRNAISKNALMDRLFNSNRFAISINAILQDLFSKEKIFGIPVGLYAYQYENGVKQVLSGFWIFDNLQSSGLFGALFFLGGIIIAIKKLFNYIDHGEDEEADRYQIAGYVLGFLFVSLILFDNYPLINANNLSPFFTSSPLIIVLFLLGYAFNKVKPEIKEEKPQDNKEEEDDEIIKI